MEKGLPIVRIRSDRGREFDNVDINHFCESKEIKHEFLALRTLQQNRVAKKKKKKKKNHVLQEMACVMV